MGDRRLRVHGRGRIRAGREHCDDSLGNRQVRTKRRHRNRIQGQLRCHRCVDALVARRDQRVGVGTPFLFQLLHVAPGSSDARRSRPRVFIRKVARHRGS